MNPGARPHCGTSAVPRVGGQRLDPTHARDVFGQVEVMRAGLDGGLGNERREVEGQALMTIA